MGNHLPDIAKKMKAARKKTELSQRRFATRLGLSHKTISAYETGKAVPSLKVMQHISDIYQINLLESSETYKNQVQDKITQIEDMLSDIKLLLG